MIRLATQDDKCGIAALWDECFPGDAAFRDRFLRDMFAPDTTVVLDDNGDVRGMIHFTLQDYCYHGDSIPAAYIFGVGTHPDNRGNGVAQAMMARVFDELYRRGVAVALLVPNGDNLFEFYRKLGFTTTCYIEKIPIHRNAIPQSSDAVLPLPSAQAHEANILYEEVLRHRCHLCRTPDYWRFAISASEGWGGGAVCVRRNGRLAGFAVYERDGGDKISELFAEDEGAYNALRLELLNIFGTDFAVMNAPACPHGARPFGMARVVDAQRLLEHGIAYRDGDFAIELVDPLIAQNTRRYVSNGGMITTEVSHGTAALSPSDFTNILMEAGPAPYMGLVFSDE